jgi:hypothetical protein
VINQYGKVIYITDIRLDKNGKVDYAGDSSVAPAGPEVHAVAKE